MWWLNLGDAEELQAEGLSRVLYCQSVDAKSWTAVNYLPLGEKGSAYDLNIEQANVILHEDRFYLFSSGYTTNRKKYGGERTGVFCLTAERPEGPWVPSGAGILIDREFGDPEAWDHYWVLNPLPIQVDGKWHIYYKGYKERKSPTNNGVAISDNLLGPYEKHDKNPLLKGHGHFAFHYKNGIVMIPHYQWWMHWSRDGIHFAPIVNDKAHVFRFGAIFLENDPLVGGTGESAQPGTYWGFETVRKLIGVPENPRSVEYDVDRFEWLIP